MKKIYSMILGAVVAGSALAQAPIDEKFLDHRNQMEKLDEGNTYQKMPFNKGVSASRDGEFSGWVNYGNAYGTATDSTNGALYAVGIWPDTNVVITYSGDGQDYHYHTWTNNFHAGGENLDLTASAFETAYGTSGVFNSTTEFSIDSMSFAYIYNKADAGATDTLRIFVIEEDGLFHYDAVGSTSGNPYPWIAYHNASHLPVWWDTVITVVLSDDDASAVTNSQYGYAFKELSLGYTADAGNSVAFAVHYYPGSTYGPNDQKNLTTEVNRFSLLYTGEAAHRDSTNLLSLQHDDPVTHNQGMIVDYWQRHGMNESSLDSVYLPSYINNIFNVKTSIDHMYSWFKVTEQVDVNVEELIATKASFDVYPNPASGTVNVSLASTTEAIEMYDILGNLVYFNANPSLTNRVNVAELSAGMYSIKVGNEIEKVIIK